MCAGFSSRRRPADRRLLALCVPLVVAPFVVVAVRALAVDQHLLLAGDQALIGLDTHDALRLQQVLGAYSRYGFAHPGPVWFYLLAPVYALTGSTSAALVAAAASVNAVFAGLLVTVVHRRGVPWLTLAAVGLISLFVLRMPPTFFVEVWNPFALLLPTALFLVCAAEAAATVSLPWLLGAGLVGSFLVQTHVGTAPLVVLVSLVAAAGVVVGWRRGRLSARGWLPPLVVLVLLWVPPLVQQLTAAPRAGNLRRLAGFARHSAETEAGHPARASVAAVGRVLAMAPYGWGSGPLVIDVSTLPPGVLAVLVGQVVAALGLVVAGYWWGARRAGWTGALVLVALAAGLVAARSAAGPLYWYLLVWVSVLPLSSALGYAELVLTRRLRPAGVARWPRPTAVVAGAVFGCVVAGLAAGAALLLAGAAQVRDSPGTHAAVALADQLPLGSPVTLDLAGPPLWPVAAGLAYHLVSEGDQLWVSPAGADLFGADRVAARPVGTVLVLTTPGSPGVTGRLLGTFDTEVGPAGLYLQPAG